MKKKFLKKELLYTSRLACCVNFGVILQDGSQRIIEGDKFGRISFEKKWKNTCCISGFSRNEYPRYGNVSGVFFSRKQFAQACELFQKLFCDYGYKYMAKTHMLACGM